MQNNKMIHFNKKKSFCFEFYIIRVYFKTHTGSLRKSKKKLYFWIIEGLKQEKYQQNKYRCFISKYASQI